ncbi:MAG: hypothetical protein QNK23_08095 [Crocinitomicaceae bacterium]|nr:hypothetical protein [Crocinitomicaceae bacterium]
MKNSRNSIALLLSFITSCAIGQTLEDLRAPSMPAATMIGSQVNEISRPRSLKALEASLLNNFMDSSNNFVIPDGYALEFNPFMLTKRRNFNYADYLEHKKENFYRNISISMASTNSFLVNDSVKTNGLGFGLRMILYNGQVDGAIKDKYLIAVGKSDSLMSVQADLTSFAQDYADSIGNNANLDDKMFKVFLLKKLNTVARLSEGNRSLMLNIIEDLPDSTNNENIADVVERYIEEGMRGPNLDHLTSLMKDAQTERYGFRAELNTAMGLSFPTNDFFHSYVPKYGAWINVSYRIPKRISKNTDVKFKNADKKATPFEFAGMLRIINVNREFVNSYQPIDSASFEPGFYFDAGLRFNVDYKKFSAGLEYIYRQNRSTETITVDGNEYSRTVLNDGYKFHLNLNYNIKDNIVLSYNIGKNYNLDGSQGDLISGFTLNLGFGDVKTRELLNQNPTR